jgi:photosystem II stability/assembly factor-like uncharacterized protein
MIWPCPEDPSRLLLVDQGEVYFSTDGGANWTRPLGGDTPEPASSAGWLLGDPVVYNQRATYRLNEAEDTWTELWQQPLYDRYSALALDDEGQSLLLWGEVSGIQNSTDGGASWSPSMTGLPAYGPVQALAQPQSAPETLYAGLAARGVWKTTDDGLSWQPVNSGMEADPAFNLSARALAVAPGNSQRLLASMERTGNTTQYLYLSTNGADSWSRVEAAPEDLTSCIHFVEKTSGVVLLGTLGDGIWRSSDNGATFTKVDGFPQYSNIDAITEESGGRLFASQQATFNTQGGVWYSDNAGRNWTFTTAAEDPDKIGGLSAMAADSSEAGTVMGVLPGGSVFITRDNGDTWNSVQSGLPDGGYEPAGLAADSGSSGHFYVALRYAGIYRTPDYGASWTLISPDSFGNPLVQGVPSSSLLYSERHEGTLFAGSAGAGIHFTQLEQVLPTLTPTATATVQPVQTSTPTQTSPVPPSPTPTPAPVASLNGGVADETFAVNPVSPVAGDQVTASVRVFNNGTQDIADAAVDFYWSLDGGSRSLLGRATVPSLPARSWHIVTCPATLNVDTPGSYLLTAVFDGDEVLAETDETDNETATAFYARTAGSDTEPPSGDIIAGGGSPFTANSEVGVSLPASDNDSGVQWMYLTAWAYDPYTNEFFSYYVSGWMPYQPEIRVQLLGYDLEVISVNYADADANVSDTYWDYINYTPSYESYVWYDYTNWYCYYLPENFQVTLTAQVTWGDADLYMAAPSNSSAWSWSSANDGTVMENLSFTTPEEGFYWLAVYGYLDSEYTLIGSGSPAGGNKAGSAGPLVLGRRNPGAFSPLSEPQLPEIVRVPSPGADLDNNGEIDYRDLFLSAAAWGTPAGDDKWDARLGGVDTESAIGARHLIQWLRLR